MARAPIVVNERLAELVRAANEDGLRWKDVTGIAPATMSKIVNVSGYRLSDRKATALDEALGWVEGTSRDIAAGRTTQPVRRVAASDSAVSGMRDGSPIAKAGGRGEGELSDTEREVVAKAAVLMGQAAALQAQVAEMLAAISKPPEKP